ncbi:MAG TPA: hypothetical protein VGH33_06440 [Isosphaeraceae bacterium]
MIELECWCCGWDGRLRGEFAGQRVTRKWCRATNAVPEPATQEVFVADWLAAIDARWTDPGVEAPTVEIECPPAV